MVPEAGGEVAAVFVGSGEDLGKTGGATGVESGVVDFEGMELAVDSEYLDGLGEGDRDVCVAIIGCVKRSKNPDESEFVETATVSSMDSLDECRDSGRSRAMIFLRFACAASKSDLFGLSSVEVAESTFCGRFGSDTKWSS